MGRRRRPQPNKNVAKLAQKLRQRGKEPGGPTSAPTTNATKDSAINTSALSGARGGLGEAKVINIRIDTMQRVEVKDGKGWKDASQNAIEVLVRTLNNMSYSQGGM